MLLLFPALLEMERLGSLEIPSCGLIPGILASSMGETYRGQLELPALLTGLDPSEPGNLPKWLGFREMEPFELNDGPTGQCWTLMFEAFREKILALPLEDVPMSVGPC